MITRPLGMMGSAAYPVVNPGLGAVSSGRRHMFRPPVRAWMGQAPASVPLDQNNVILGMPLWSVLARRVLAMLIPNNMPDTYAPNAQMPRYLETPYRQDLFDAGWPNKVFSADAKAPGPAGGQFPFSDVVYGIVGSSLEGASAGRFPWTRDVIQKWMVAGPSPTSDESADIGLIDGFFGPTSAAGMFYAGQDPWLILACKNGSFDPGDPMDYFGPGALQEPARMPSDPHRVNKIPLGGSWCSPSLKNLAPTPLVVNAVAGNGIGWGNYPDQVGQPTPNMVFWGVTSGTLWGAVKPWIQNAVLADKILMDYPFPSPFARDYPWIWPKYVLGDFRALIKTGAPLSEDDIRVWITLSVLANYDKMVAELEQYLKAQARDARRDALRKTIASVVFGALTLMAGLPLVVSQIVSSAISAVNTVNQLQFQKDMAGVAAAFKSSDPGFSSEVDNAAAYSDRLMAALKKGAPIADVRKATQAAPLPVSTPVIVGGAAAAGLGLAFLLFR